MKHRPTVLEVSDHAVLRWLERAHGLDIDAIRALLAGFAMTGAELGAQAVRLERIKYVLTEAEPIEDGRRMIMTTVVRTDNGRRIVYRRR